MVVGVDAVALMEAAYSPPPVNSMGSIFDGGGKQFTQAHSPPLPPPLLADGVWRRGLGQGESWLVGIQGAA